MDVVELDRLAGGHVGQAVFRVALGHVRENPEALGVIRPTGSLMRIMWCSGRPRMP